jgi:hypothetical protein
MEGSRNGLMDDYPGIFVEGLRKITENPSFGIVSFPVYIKLCSLGTNEKYLCLM